MPAVLPRDGQPPRGESSSHSSHRDGDEDGRDVVRVLEVLGRSGFPLRWKCLLYINTVGIILISYTSALPNILMTAIPFWLSIPVVVFT